MMLVDDIFAAFLAAAAARDRLRWRDGQHDSVNDFA